MASGIAGPSSIYYFNGRSYENLHPSRCGPYNLRTTRCLKKIDQRHLLLRYLGEKHGVHRFGGMTVSDKILAKASSSSSSSDQPSSSPWIKWLWGIILSVILPVAGYKGGPLVALIGKVDQALETAERVTEVVEEIAEKAEEIVEEVEEKLPGDSKLKEKLESFDGLAKLAVDEAQKVEHFIHKVKEVEEKMVARLRKDGKDQAKK